MSKIDRLGFDVRKLKEVNSLERLNKLFVLIGRERFQSAFSELDAVEAAVICLLYYDTWQGMIDVCDVYGVGSDNPELNCRFRARLKEKGLDRMVASWYQRKDAA